MVVEIRDELVVVFCIQVEEEGKLAVSLADCEFAIVEEVFHGVVGMVEVGFGILRGRGSR